MPTTTMVGEESAEVCIKRAIAGVVDEESRRLTNEVFPYLVTSRERLGALEVMEGNNSGKKMEVQRALVFLERGAVFERPIYEPALYPYPVDQFILFEFPKNVEKLFLRRGQSHQSLLPFQNNHTALGIDFREMPPVTIILPRSFTHEEAQLWQDKFTAAGIRTRVTRREPGAGFKVSQENYFHITHPNYKDELVSGLQGVLAQRGLKRNRHAFRNALRAAQGELDARNIRVADEDMRRIVNDAFLEIESPEFFEEWIKERWHKKVTPAGSAIQPSALSQTL